MSEVSKDGEDEKKAPMDEVINSVQSVQKAIDAIPKVKPGERISIKPKNADKTFLAVHRNSGTDGSWVDSREEVSCDNPFVADDISIDHYADGPILRFRADLKTQESGPAIFGFWELVLPASQLDEIEWAPIDAETSAS